jgi:hypothetical protein
VSIRGGVNEKGDRLDVKKDKMSGWRFESEELGGLQLPLKVRS